MKRAIDAFNEAKYHKKINALKEDVENSINEAVLDGKFSCVVQFDNEIPDSAREAIRDELKDAGYSVNIPMRKERPIGCPVEQWGYFDEMEIDWRKS